MNEIDSTNWETISLINAGGQGIVEVVEADGRRLARKLLKLEAADFLPERADLLQSKVKRFHREIDLLLGLKSPFIIEVIEQSNKNYGTGTVAPAYLMPLAETTLENLFAQQIWTVDQGRAVGLLLQTLLGICTLHQNDIIHRDLKPSNVLIVNGVPKICDLGLSKRYQIENISATLLTRVGEKAGTHGFSAPEQFYDLKSASKTIRCV